MNKFRVSLSVTVEQITDNGLGTKLDVMSKSGVIRSIAGFETIKSLGADGFKGALDEFVSNVHGVLVFDNASAKATSPSEVVQFAWEREARQPIDQKAVAVAMSNWLASDGEGVDQAALIEVALAQGIITTHDKVELEVESIEHGLAHLFTADGNVIAIFPDGHVEIHA